MSSCNEAIVAEITNSLILKSVELIMLLSSILAIPVLIYMFQSCQKSTLIHFNIKLIGGFHCICLIIHCVARTLQHSTDLYLYYLSNLSPCDKIPSIPRCLITRIPYVFGLFSASYSTVFMVIERTIATKNYKKYENRQKTLGFSLIFCQIFMGATTSFAIFWNFDFQKPSEFCSASKSSDPFFVIFPEFLAIFSNFAAFFQFNRLIRINKKMRICDTETNLSQKYQIQENLSIISVLKAFTQCDFVFILMYFTIGIPFHFFAKFLSHAEYYALFETIYFVPLYSLIMPAYIYQFSKKMFEKCDLERTSTLQNSTFLHISEIIMLSLSLIAIPIGIWALAKCVKSTYFHINIRLIGGLHCTCLLIHCVGRVIQHSSSLYSWLGNAQECDKRQYLSVCLISRGMYIFGMYSSSFTTVFMCIERTIATRFYKKYEKESWNLGVLLVFLQTFLSLLITFEFYENSNFADRPVYCIFEIRREWAFFCEFLTICSNFLAFWQCWRLNRINTNLRISESTCDLSQKFQVEENKTLIKILIRFTFLDFIFMITYFLLGFLVQLLEGKMSEPVFLAVFELIHCVPLYTIVVLLIMGLIIRKIQNGKVKKMFEEVKIKDDAYFQYFQKQWT